MLNIDPFLTIVTTSFIFLVFYFEYYRRRLKNEFEIEQMRLKNEGRKLQSLVRQKLCSRYFDPLFVFPNFEQIGNNSAGTPNVKHLPVSSIVELPFGLIPLSKKEMESDKSCSFTSETIKYSSESGIQTNVAPEKVLLTKHRKNGPRCSPPLLAAVAHQH